MNTIYYKGDLIPAEDWDYSLSKPKNKSGKKESKKTEAQPLPEVSTPQE